MSVYSQDINLLNSTERLEPIVSGKLALYVNVSSKYGYTPKCSNLWSWTRTAREFWELQQIHDRYKDKGFTVVGLPCNQFGGMEPGTEEEIQEFMTKQYPFVTFPITEKIEVNGPNEHPIYTELKGPWRRNVDDNRANGGEAASAGHNKAGEAMARIPHSWEKFLVTRDGVMFARFNWQDRPLAEVPLYVGASWTISEAIESLLD